MAIHFLQNAVVLYGGYNFSSDINQTAVELGAEPLDVTTFGQGTRINLAGLQTVATNMTGFWDSDTGDTQPHDVLFPDIGATSNPVVSVFPLSSTDGQRGFSYKSTRVSYNPAGTVGEMFTFSADGPAAKSRLMNTTVLTNATAATTSATGTAAQIGALTSTGALYGVLHVTNTAASGTFDMVLESDSASGFASATTRATFTQVGTAVAAEYIASSLTSSSGDDWWRASYTISSTGGPSYDFVVGMTILPKL